MPREKMEKVVVTFSTTTQALQIETAARAAEISGRLIPVPRQISAGCGMAFAAPAVEKERLQQLISLEEIEVEGIYELLL